MRRLTRLHASGRASDLDLAPDEAWARLVAAGPVSRSRMMARGMTMTTAAPSPWTKRMTMSSAIEPAR